MRYIVMSVALMLLVCSAHAVDFGCGSLTVNGTGGWVLARTPNLITPPMDLTSYNPGGPVAVGGWVDLSESILPNPREWSKFYFSLKMRDASAYNRILAVNFCSDWLGDWRGIPPQPWDRIRYEFFCSGDPVYGSWWPNGGPKCYFCTVGGFTDDTTPPTRIYPSDRVYYFQSISDWSVSPATWDLWVYGKGFGGGNEVDYKQWLHIGTWYQSTTSLADFGIDETNIQDFYLDIWGCPWLAVGESAKVSWRGLRVGPPVPMDQPPPANLILSATPDSLYVKPGEPVTVLLSQSDLETPASGYQAFIQFDPAMLGIAEDNIVFEDVPYGQFKYKDLDPPYIDLADGITGPAPAPTDALLATLTFTAGSTDGVTRVWFREFDPPTMFSDDLGNEIPANTVDTQQIVIDGTNPSVTVTSPNGGEFLKGGGSWEITWTASDANLDPNSIKIEYWDGDSWELIASGEANDGSYTWNPVPSLDIATALVRVTASDLAGNEGSDVSDAAFTIDSTQPTVDNITLTVNADGSGEDLTPSGTAIQGVYYVSAYVSDNLAGIDWTALPTITVVDAEYNSLVTGPVIADQANNRFYVQITVTAASANGTAGITVAGVKDKSGNEADVPYDTFNINKSQAVVTVQLEQVTVGSVDRWIKFVIGGTGGTVPPVTIFKKLTFVNGTATATFTNLPNDGAWTKISAKDEQHTLRQTVDLVDTGNKQFTASFTGSDQLIGGDLTNDNLVDIRDFGVLAGQYGTSPDLNTQWPVRNANIACDGLVDSNDYTYIQIHFLARGDAEVGNALVASADLPKTSITVYELALLIGMRDALKADLNGDKVVNATDIQLFMLKNVKR